MRIIVTGGFGDLGSRVAREAGRRGHDVEAVSRRTGLDLATGVGLVAALHGAEVVVNCADDPRRGDVVTVGGTRSLAEAASAAQAPVHLVHISIVGIDDFPMAYYRRKLAAEAALAASGAAVTVLRATQFHSLAATFARSLTRGGLTLQIGGMAFQSVDIDWVAAELVDLAEAPRPTRYHRAPDIAGPEVLSVAQIAGSPTVESRFASFGCRHRSVRYAPSGGVRTSPRPGRAAPGAARSPTGWPSSPRPAKGDDRPVRTAASTTADPVDPADTINLASSQPGMPPGTNPAASTGQRPCVRQRAAEPST